MEDVSAQNLEVPSEKKQNKKIVIVILLIICGIILLLLLTKVNFTSNNHPLVDQTNQTGQINQQNPSTSSSQTQAVAPLPQINTVSLTKNGFSPEKITIKKGTAVKWINNSGTDKASVNSDDYPTNTRFPELNLGQFNEGSSVAHIFTTTGTYTYHNQFNPKQTGTIIVE